MISGDEKVSAILLSGGRGRRFGFADKGLIEWKGKALVEHVLSRLKPQCDQILINCNQNAQRYQEFGFSVFEDETKDFPGPLEGIRSTSPAVLYPWCLVCPNDMPNLPLDLVSRLRQAAEDQQWQIAYPVCGDRKHYLPVLIKSDILHTVEKQLLTPDRSLHGWYRHFSSGEVNFSNQAEALANINSPEALQQLP